MKRTDPDQGNLIDGTIVAYDPREEGAYVTVIGSEGQHIIVSFDENDLARLGGPILRAVWGFDPDEDQIRITPRGVEHLTPILAAEFKLTEAEAVKTDVSDVQIFGERGFDA